MTRQKPFIPSAIGTALFLWAAVYDLYHPPAVPSQLAEINPPIAIVIGVAILGLVGVGGLLLYQFLTRTRDEEEKLLAEVDRELEGSRFEQILSELQGIRLNFESGIARSTFPKLARLVRVFLARIGLNGAREMSTEKLKDAIGSSNLSPKQIQLLMSILERCEEGEGLDPNKLEFDPLEVVRDLKYIVYQMEGRQLD